MTTNRRRPDPGSASASGPLRGESPRRPRWRVALAAALTVLALIAAASGAYQLWGDTPRAAQYAGPTPGVVEHPGDGQRLATQPIVPQRIDIPDAEVNTIVEPASATEEFNRFTGEVALTFPVPGGPFTTVWWEEGPAPGDDGLAVVLGHTRASGASVFGHLAELTGGEVIGITGLSDQGEQVVARYVVTSVVTDISKADDRALRTVLDAAPSGATLALITCGGEVDQVLSSHSDNAVVFATLEGMYRS